MSSRASEGIQQRLFMSDIRFITPCPAQETTDTDTVLSYRGQRRLGTSLACHGVVNYNTTMSVECSRYFDVPDVVAVVLQRLSSKGCI